MKLLDIDLRLLELFCCVYEKGSISETSNCLHLSQSTISFHLHHLEKSIGLRLFYKQGRRLVPTSNARMLYPYARKLLDLKLSLLEEIKLLTGSYRGYIKVGAGSSLGNCFLMEFVHRYISKNPSTQIDLQVEGSEIVSEKVLSGELDIGFVSLLPAHHSIQAREFWEDTLLFVGSREVDSELSIKELVKLPFILREEASGTRKFLEDLLTSVDVDIKSLKVLLTLNREELIFEALKSLKAVSFVSSTFLQEKCPPHVKVLKVKGIEPPTRKFYAIHHKDRPVSPAVQNFIEELNQYMQEVKA